MENGRTDPETCADRALAEAVARRQIGDLKTAAALFRLTACYVERLGEGTDTGEIVAFPSPARWVGLVGAR
jgi:hypothetical protein